MDSGDIQSFGCLSNKSNPENGNCISGLILFNVDSFKEHDNKRVLRG
ncbi:hypothetical protein SBF1_2650002 [Candidatus Desulfosporosinus infrequens]|uniref:Uncharacterized protein n=1 Tax=Candidatus Desulfosporosinus infrequens TaxID=2043169 RepID=A0A2U3KSL6_9FIRM|nr:hypothetical protein SBF1_2650002 [Candidatus Desulfosporosinus infrequens]